MNWADSKIEGELPLREVRSILLLGGTSEAVRLAQLFVQDLNVDIITSLAGREKQFLKPPGRLYVGHFSNMDAIAEFIVNERICVIIDATPPFARSITYHALEAAKVTQIPHLLLERAPWVKTSGDEWIEVPNIETAVKRIPKRCRALLAVGQQDVSAFAQRTDCWFLMRLMDKPEEPIPPGKIVLGRPYDTADNECALMSDYRLTCVVAKNTGGPGYAKIEAANWMGLPVVMVKRPELPDCKKVSIVGDAAVWLRNTLKEVA